MSFYFLQMQSSILPCERAPRAEQDWDLRDRWVLSLLLRLPIAAVPEQCLREGFVISPMVWRGTL